jgi:hypothetical protein
VLEAGGWPRDLPLASAEHQQCERFRELLGEFSLLEAGGDRLGAGQALELLQALATRTAFDAATGDVAVTVTASTDDPLIGYDGIWVAGLSSDAWPLPPRADPFVPLAAQQSRRAVLPASCGAAAWRSGPTRSGRPSPISAGPRCCAPAW